MSTQKVAVTIPKNLVTMIDMISKKEGVSRSRYISRVLAENLLKTQDRRIGEAYDSVFSDTKIRKEQLDISNWFEGSGCADGQEW